MEDITHQIQTGLSIAEAEGKLRVSDRIQGSTRGIPTEPVIMKNGGESYT